MLVTQPPLYHTPPSACKLLIRNSARLLLPAFLDMTSVDILEQVQPSQILNSFPVFLVPKPDGGARLIYDCHEWTSNYKAPPVYLPRRLD